MKTIFKRLDKRLEVLEGKRSASPRYEFNKVSYPRVCLLQSWEMNHYGGILKKLRAGADMESVVSLVHPMVWEAISSLHAAIEERCDDFEKLSEDEIKGRCQYVKKIMDRCQYPISYYSDLSISHIPVSPLHPRIRSGKDRLVLFFGEMDISWLDEPIHYRTDGEFPGLLTLEELTPIELARLKELENYQKTRPDMWEKLPSGAKAYKGRLTREELREEFNLIGNCYATWESRGLCVTPKGGRIRDQTNV